MNIDYKLLSKHFKEIYDCVAVYLNFDDSPNFNNDLVIVMKVKCIENGKVIMRQPSSYTYKELEEIYIKLTEGIP